MSTNTEPTTLAGLIRREQDQNGSSYNDIAKKCGLSKAKVGQLADPDSRFQVRAETIEKLAMGLRLPLVVVQRAALATAGIVDEPSQKTARVDLITHQLQQLDDESLALLEAMIDAAVKHVAGRRG